MNFRYWLLLFFCSSLHPMWWQHPHSTSGQTTSSLFLTPRVRSSRSLRIPTSLVRSPILSRIAQTSKTGFMSAAIAALGAVRAYTMRQQAIPLRVNPEEIARLNQVRNLRDDISDFLKKEQSKHLVGQGYTPLAPTTESQHFEKYYPVERITQLVKTKKLEEQLKKDYFFMLDEESGSNKRLKQLLEEQKEINAEQQKHPSSWWQQIRGLVQKSPEQQELAQRFATNREQIKSIQQEQQQKTQQFQTIAARIEALN